MSLDASDVQTDEDFYEDLVRPSLWLGCGGCMEMKGGADLIHKGGKQKENGAWTKMQRLYLPLQH